MHTHKQGVPEPAAEASLMNAAPSVVGPPDCRYYP
eukprot:COSAG06_NODE_1001_length_11135_cov_3.577111_10_plen_35_part_00